MRVRSPADPTQHGDMVEIGHHHPNTAFAQNRGNTTASAKASRFRFEIAGSAVPDLNSSLM